MKQLWLGRLARPIYVLAVVTSLFALAAAPADAAGKKLGVAMSWATVPDCSVAPDKVRMAIGFQAKVKAKNVKAPSRINVSYKVSNPQTGEVKVAESVVLKPIDYFNVGTFLGYTVGSQWQFDGSFTYKDTATGRRVTKTTSMPFTVYTNDELTTAQVPSCV